MCFLSLLFHVRWLMVVTFAMFPQEPHSQGHIKEGWTFLASWQWLMRYGVVF
jgi:hypothetical protein